MTLIFIILLTAMFYSVAERHTRDCSFKRVGGLRFVRIGRLFVQFSIRKAG